MTVFILKRELRTGQRMTKLPEHWTTLALCPALQSLQTAVLDPETYDTIFSTSHLLGLDMSIHQDKIKKNGSSLCTIFIVVKIVATMDFIYLLKRWFSK